ncbi:c-type cytochrome [Jannaschia seohaensis]|uniref:Cbb3-type cytochrome c oxidase subunit III n=1 Tax=Jannaschia seohaensis TaxID=475081 RepID=A0A2Y9ASX7_9RHOB|nr:cytochrome c [Jannaschia seohaensis]PWJ17472.1 cbb3-type cytochrome c oxidase subunit III [Jannaschia seohaensis]SSA47550.1 Cytochrome C oxidase, cbb3-type, subunit III [Jannaschia seohaensis]
MRPLALLLLLAACQPHPPTEAEVDATRGAALFARDCSDCHGADGTGVVGPDLTGLGQGDAFPTVRVMAQIDGLGRHGDPDAVMPEFGAGDMGDTVIVEEDGIGTPIPADLLALATYLRTIQR